MSTIVPVLLYHRVSDAPGDPFAVSPVQFQEHVQAVRDSGRTPLTISELADALRGEARLPERPVAITFDDGFHDTVAATELLRAAGLRATVYVTTGAIGRDDNLSRDEIEALAAHRESIEIGAHTVSHPYLDEVALELAHGEVVDSKVALEDLIGRTVETFAYPHGAYDARVRQLVIGAGFRSGAAVKNALSHAQDDPWAIARWTVRSSTSAERVVEFLDGRAAPLAWERERVATRVYRRFRKLRRALHTYGASATVEPANAPASASPRVRINDAPVAIAVVDVAHDVTDVDLGSPRHGGRYRDAALMVRDGAHPLGWITVRAPSSGALSADEVQGAVRTVRVANLAGQHRQAMSAGRQHEPELLSVVFATCGDAEAAVNCVHRIMRHGHGRFEVIVVENRPMGSPVPAALRSTFGDTLAVKYVEEPNQGLSHARNAGLRTAAGRYVAFIDDDVTIDEYWMPSIREAFQANPDATCVTGPIFPVELETTAQVLVEQFATYSKGLSRQRYNLDEDRPQTPLFPYAAGHIGSGANMAFRTETLRALGGFDVALGAGTPARGGEDLEILVRMIRAGKTVVYEPSAVVWHRHPHTLSMVNRQALGYGIGLGAMLGKQLLVEPGRLAVLRLIPKGVQYLLSPSSRKNAGKHAEFPRRVTMLERLGMASGPLAYAVSRLKMRLRPAPQLPRGEATAAAERVWSGELEWTDPVVPTSRLTTTAGACFDQARLLVRVAGEPVGFVPVKLSEGVLEREAALAAVQAELGDPVRLVEADGSPMIAAGNALVSVVLCTRNRPTGVRRCLDSLIQLRHEELELIVVDNAPSDDATAMVVREYAAKDVRVR